MNEKNNKVLVIDDNQVIRRLAKTLLTKRDYVVELAKNGPEGIEAAQKIQPQVILLDVMMPNMDGYEVCRRIKSEETIKDIPIIMVTSKTETLDKIKGLEIGAADYIVKPFDQGELLARIATQVKMKNLWEELQEKNRLLEELIKKDGLTDLYNHRYFQDRLAEEFSRARRYDFPMSLIMLDIDHFKQINDNYGHQAGDEILQYLGKLFQQQLSPQAIACRYGGEEFAIVLPGIDLPTAKQYAEKLRLTFKQYRHKTEKAEIQSTISIGLAYMPKHGNTGHGLLTAADNALYKSKYGGRNCITVAE